MKAHGNLSDMEYIIILTDINFIIWCEDCQAIKLNSTSNFLVIQHVNTNNIFEQIS